MVNAASVPAAAKTAVVRRGITYLFGTGAAMAPGSPRLDRRDLLLARAHAAGDRLVLDPLVLGAGDRSGAQDRQLAPPGVELALAEDRAAEAQQGADRRVGVGDRAKDVQ